MEHENVMHLLADSLIDYFEGSSAVNYIEHTFQCKNDESKSFVMTMQKVEGLTPCQKLAKAEKLNAEMYEMLEKVEDEITHLVNEINKELMSHVNCQTITPPDLYDMETCYNIQVLLAKARGEHV